MPSIESPSPNHKLKILTKSSTNSWIFLQHSQEDCKHSNTPKHIRLQYKHHIFNSTSCRLNKPSTNTSSKWLKTTWNGNILRNHQTCWNKIWSTIRSPKSKIPRTLQASNWKGIFFSPPRKSNWGTCFDQWFNIFIKQIQLENKWLHCLHLLLWPTILWSHHDNIGQCNLSWVTPILNMH